MANPRPRIAKTNLADISPVYAANCEIALLKAGNPCGSVARLKTLLQECLKLQPESLETMTNLQVLTTYLAQINNDIMPPTVSKPPMR